jgi:hypothetical protein
MQIADYERDPEPCAGYPSSFKNKNVWLLKFK